MPVNNNLDTNVELNRLLAQGMITPQEWRDRVLAVNERVNRPIVFDDVFEAPQPVNIRNRPARPDRANRAILDDLYSWRTKPVEEDMSSKEVTDYRGKKQPRESCVKVRGYYYLLTDANLFIDDLTGEYEISDYKRQYTKKLVLKSNGDTDITYGYTSTDNAYRLITYYSRLHQKVSEGQVFSIDDISGWKCKERLENACIVDFEEKDLPISQIKHYDVFKNRFSKCTDNKTLIKIGAKSPSFLLTEGVKQTFGVEIEVSNGYLPHRMSYDFNIACVRDGSIDNGNGPNSGGAEYVTGVLTGDTGFNHLQDLCSELVKRTKVNHSVGVHIHLGGVAFTKQLLVNSYILYCILESEVLATLPKSRRDNAYCRPLKKFKSFKIALKKDTPELEEDYNSLFSHMTSGHAKFPGRGCNSLSDHPRGAKCGYDKATPRYCWVNYVPAMFDTRGGGDKSKTIEIRNHSGSTNFNKIKNWILIQMAILAYADNYPQLITPNTDLAEVLTKIFPKRAKLLINYVEERKLLFSNDDAEKSEYSEKAEKKQTIRELCA